MISTTLQMKSSLIKAIHFEQFLELLNALSSLVHPKLAAPKALKKLLKKFQSLLTRIEHQNQGPASIYSTCLMQQAMMAYTSDIYAVITQLQPVLRQVYIHYFQSEMNATSQKTRKTFEELRKESLDCCLTFLKDFGLCPYVVNRKLCFYVWHTIKETIGMHD
jgi:hypothetical protein